MKLDIKPNEICQYCTFLIGIFEHFLRECYWLYCQQFSFSISLQADRLESFGQVFPGSEHGFISYQSRGNLVAECVLYRLRQLQIDAFLFY